MMKPEFRLMTVAIIFGLSLATVAIARGSGVPILAGDYVVEGESCASAPLADLKHYDGRNFSGAHSSQCSSVVIARQGHTFTVATTCRALGDGTPAAPDTWSERIKILPVKRFVSLPAVGLHTSTIYALCVDPSH